jgi:peptide/nickel transport system substrate-binding protein
MCTGPFSLKSWSSGQSIVLAANPNYWDPSLKPKASTFTFTFLRDPSTITNGLITGTIDGTWRAPVSNLSVLQSAPDGKLYMNQSSFTGSLLMSSFQGALHDVKVRQALQKVVDYKGIVNAVLQGAGEPAAAFATPATWGYSHDIFAAGYAKLPPASQDVSGAQALIKEAGGAPSQPIVIGVDAGNQPGVAAVTSIQDSARKIGLNVQIKTFESAAFANVLFDPKAREGLDMVFVTATTDLAEPLELYAQGLPGSPYDWTKFANPAFSDPMTQALGEPDPTTRANLVVQGQASFAEQVQLLPVYSPYELLFMNKKITGPPVSSLSSLYYPWAATVGAP